MYMLNILEYTMYLSNKRKSNFICLFYLSTKKLNTCICFPREQIESIVTVRWYWNFEFCISSRNKLSTMLPWDGSIYVVSGGTIYVMHTVKINDKNHSKKSIFHLIITYISYLLFNAYSNVCLVCKRNEKKYFGVVL